MRLASSSLRLLRAGLGRVLSTRQRKTLRYLYARIHLSLGLDYFPAHNDLDRKLLAYIGDIKGGTFIEAGANDGLSQSNTWHLEMRLGWTGLLIEPIPEFARLCGQFRSRSKTRNCALGGFEQDGERVTLHYGALMTVTEGASATHMHGGSVSAHASEGASWVGDESYTFESEVRSLSRLAEEAGISRADLLSLDVEGFEVNVLRGINFDKLRIDYILVETSDFEAVRDILKVNYVLIDRLSAHDYLFKSIH